MVAPGLPEIAKQYNITNSTEVAMTLSIFLLSLAISVRSWFRLFLDTRSGMLTMIDPVGSL